MAVRGTFDLNDRPAVEGLGRIKRAGAEADVVLGNLGRTMDDVFSERNAAEARGYVRDLNEVRDAALEVEAALRSVGSVDARPNINLRGVAEANAQLDALEVRLRRLGAMTARPGVNVGQSGRVPGGGGGGGFGRGRGLDVPFAGSIPWPLVLGALGAAPPLIGGATGLIGSAGAAALGAGALGLTGYATAGVGAGLAAGPTVETIKGIKEASKALAAYQKQVIETGPNSKKAAEKLRAYNIVASQTPGATDFLRSRTLFSQEFNAMTKPGQESVAGIGTRGINLGRQLLPVYSSLSNEFLAGAQTQTGNFANFLNSSRSRGFYNAIGGEATNDLPAAEQTLENISGTIMNITRASRPFFHEGVVFLEKWTGGWEQSTHDLNDTRKDIGGMVDQLKSWAHLGGAGFDLVRDLLEPAAGPGQSMVDDLTEQLETWDKWVKDNPREISHFFESSAEGTEKIAGALGKITGLLFHLGQQLQPLVEQGANLVSLLDKAGLLSPAGLPLLLAGGAGIRNLRGAAGQRIRGGGTTAAGAGMVPIVPGIGGSRFGSFGASRYGASLGYGELGTAYQLEREAGMGRLGALSTVGRSTRLGGALETGVRGFAGSFLPYLAFSGALGAAGSEGNIFERIRNGASQATFGIIPSLPTKSQQQEQGLQRAQFLTQRVLNTPGLTLAQKNQRLYSVMARQGELARGEIEGRDGLDPDIFMTENSALAQARGKFRSYTSERRVQRAEGLFGEIGGAFETRLANNRPGAGRTAISEIEKEAKTMHGRTLKEFSQMGTEWARELAKANPKLKGVVNEFAEGIEARYARMGRQVEVINGKIVDTSGQSWSQVANLLGTSSQLAYAEVNKNFTALEKRAFAILEHMGYKPGQAQSIVHEAQTGRPTKRGSELNAEAHHHGQAGTSIHNLPPGGPNQATGGRIPYSGSLHDTVPIPGGGMAAGGELVFANRHTERAVDRLLAPAGTSLARMIASEGRAHSEPFRSFEYARGGRRPRGRQDLIGGSASAWRGIGPAGLHQGIRTVASAVLGHFPGLSITSTTGGSHVSGSLHYAGEAVDIGGDTQTMFDASQWIKQSGLYRQLTEGIHNPNLSVNDGQLVDPSYYAAVWAGHADHIHLGVAHAVGQLGRLAGGPGRGSARAVAAQQIKLNAIQSKRGGFGGAMVNRAGEMHAAGLQRNINKILAKRGGGMGLAGGTAAPGGSRSAVERQIARVLFSAGANRIGAAGIIGNAYAESSMVPGAEGTGGGGLWGFTAGAISLANLKRAGGSNWESPEFQTRFMLQHGGSGLIPTLNRSGSPEDAARIFMEQWERPGIPRQDVREAGARVAFQQGYATGGRRPGFAGWFAQGGHFRVRNPTLFGVGEAGAEDISISPAGRGSTGSGGHHFHFKVDLRGAHVGSGEDARRIGKEMAEAAAGHLADWMEQSDGVAERELTG